MSNAIKFTPKNGSIHLKCIEENNFFEISITDNGIGMPEEVSKKIFEDDSKITTFGTENEKGTGLGLTLCKEMVEKNRGTIWGESTLNKGSIFYFTIPKRTKPVLEK